jgi:hypothetical protein
VAQILNKPTIPSIAGLVPETRTLTINGTTQDLSANRTFTIATGLTVGTTPITSGTVGRVLFEGTGNVLQESSNLFFDSATSFLGVGTSTAVANTRAIIQESFTAQASTALRTRGTGSSTGVWKGRIIAGGDTVAFLMGEYNSQAWLGGHNAALSAWSPLRINPDGVNNLTDLYLGSLLTNPIMTIRNLTGNVLIGTTTDAGFKLDVNGTARVKGVGTSSATSAFTVQNSASTELFKVRDNGSILIASGILSLDAMQGYTGGHVRINRAIASQSTSTMNVSAEFEVESTTQGFLPPRMTTTQKNAIATPASGLVVYDTTLGKLCVRGAAAWETITSL